MLVSLVVLVFVPIHERGVVECGHDSRQIRCEFAFHSSEYLRGRAIDYLRQRSVGPIYEYFLSFSKFTLRKPTRTSGPRAFTRRKRHLSIGFSGGIGQSRRSCVRTNSQKVDTYEIRTRAGRAKPLARRRLNHSAKVSRGIDYRLVGDHPGSLSDPTT